jgi:hypothetical protein
MIVLPPTGASRYHNFCSTGDGRTTVSSELVCKVARSWVDVGSSHTRLLGIVYFVIASVQEFVDTPSYT